MIEPQPTYNVFLFICQTQVIFEKWEDAITSYTVHSEEIRSVYNIKNLLGEGSFGEVYLAVKKRQLSKQSLGFNQALPHKLGK